MQLFRKSRNGVDRLNKAVGQFQSIVDDLNTAATEINSEIGDNNVLIEDLKAHITELDTANGQLADEAARASRTADKIASLLR